MQAFSTRLYTDGTYYYAGMGPVGASESDPVWQVSKFTKSVPLTVQYANRGGFDQVMANYLTLAYA